MERALTCGTIMAFFMGVFFGLAIGSGFGSPIMGAFAGGLICAGSFWILRGLGVGRHRTVTSDTYTVPNMDWYLNWELEVVDDEDYEGPAEEVGMVGDNGNNYKEEEESPRQAE